jgi:SAM-dependent methyltransferase
MRDLFSGLAGCLDFDPGARETYESKVASRDRVLDVGGRNQHSKSRRILARLNRNPGNEVVSSDIFDDYEPDVVDDICHTTIAPESFDGVYCSAILEHVEEYWLAIDNIHRILKPGGEAFFYVPFFWPLHDRTDFHRFTVAEVRRMLKPFAEVRIVLPGRESGFGFVLWQILSFGAIDRFAALHSGLARLTNSVLRMALSLAYAVKKPDMPYRDFIFYYTYLYINHGFCAYVRK